MNYINFVNLVKLPKQGKAEFLLSNIPGARKINEPQKWQENIICVTENNDFELGVEMARVVDNPRVLEAMKLSNSKLKEWLYVPKAKRLVANQQLKAPAPDRLR